MGKLYGMFFGEINNASVSGTMEAMNRLIPVGQELPEVHISFHSWGGKTDAGIALHEFFRNYPAPLTIYTACALSAGAIAYLGAKRRIASAHAKFLFHRVLTGVEGKATIDELRNYVRGASVDNNRVKTILENQPDLRAREVYRRMIGGAPFPASDAVALGVAHEIGEFSSGGARIAELWIKAAD